MLLIAAAYACPTVVNGTPNALNFDVAQVVVVREGQRTTFTVSINPFGEGQGFALVMPVPEVLDESEVRTIDGDIFARLDAFTAPRRVTDAGCTPPAPTESDTDTDTDTDADTDTGGTDTADTGTDTGTDTADTGAETGDTGTDPLDVDDDGDGYSENDGDCDDTTRKVNPVRDELCGDGVDNNCDGNIDEDCESGDTGTAYLTWSGDITYDGSSVVVNYGIGAVNQATNDNVCWMTAEHSGSAEAPSGCPDCDYSFATTVTADTSGGAYCGSFATGTLFTYYAVSDFWFGGSDVKAWGFADAYTYTYAGTDYDLEQTIFMYYDDGATFNQWLMRHYNYPAGGVYNVDGDKYAASWNQIMDGDYYYYFYY